MGYKIYYTPTAKETLNIIYNLIKERFGEHAANSFITKAEKTIKLISQNPLMYKSSTIDEQVRVGFITKQSAIFYQISEQNINLLFFWDNRQETLLK